MKIYMKTEVPMRVLSKSSNPWDMNGRSGISYKVGVRCYDDIDKIKVTQEVYERLEIDKDYMLAGELSVSNGNQSFLFNEIVPNGK